MLPEGVKWITACQLEPYCHCSLQDFEQPLPNTELMVLDEFWLSAQLLALFKKAPVVLLENLTPEWARFLIRILTNEPVRRSDLPWKLRDGSGLDGMSIIDALSLCKPELIAYDMSSDSVHFPQLQQALMGNSLYFCTSYFLLGHHCDASILARSDLIKQAETALRREYEVSCDIDEAGGFCHLKIGSAYCIFDVQPDGRIRRTVLGADPVNALLDDIDEAFTGLLRFVDDAHHGPCHHCA